MDKIEKFLRRLSKQQHRMVLGIIEKILVGDLSGLDVKKLKGFPNLFRVRKGQLRILFRKKGKGYRIINIENRSDKTYKL